MAYIFLLSFLMFSLNFVSKKKIRDTAVSIDYLYFLFLILILVLFYGLRWNVGIDYMSYYSNAVERRWMEPQPGTKDVFEFGFQLLYYLGDFLTLPKNAFIVFGGILIFYFIFLGIYEYSANFMLSCFIFFGSGLFFYSLNEFRQFIAVSIIFYGYKYCAERNVFKWLCFCFLAFMFHKTCIIFSILYFFIHKKYSKILVNVLILSACVIKQFDITNILKSVLTVLPGRYAGYADTFMIIQNNGSGLISYIYAFIVLYMNNAKQRSIFYSDKNTVYFNLFVIAAIGLNIFVDFYMFTRIFEYCLISIVIVFPLFHMTAKSSHFALLLFYTVFFIFMCNIIKLSCSSPENLLLEYHTVFTRI